MKCLFNPIADCPLDNNEDGDYCWACSPDGRSERKLCETLNKKHSPFIGKQSEDGKQ
jgi:hypothetical protein